MSFYGLHTTRKEERDKVMQTPYEEIEINPRDFHYGQKPIVCEEGSGRYYEHNIEPFFDVLRKIEKWGKLDYTQTDYFRMWEYKGTEIHTRLSRLPSLFKSIKEEGIKEPVSCEVTGERLDGSFRTKIATYLGIPKVKAKLFRFNWRDIDEDFIERKLQAKKLSSPKDYYQFKYGYKDWQNVEKAGEVYEENAERYKDILPLIKGQSVLDVGCNEGYIGLQAARQGKKVTGIDLEWTHLAYLNKLIFEWIDKKDLDINFYEEDLLKTERTADTILLLNVLYHVPREKQAEFLRKFEGKQLIFQCNLRKSHVRDQYYTSHPDDLVNLLTSLKRKVKVIPWRDKPLVVCE